MRQAYADWTAAGADVARATVLLREKGFEEFGADVQVRLAAALGIGAGLPPELSVVSWTPAEATDLSNALALVRRHNGRTEQSLEVVWAQQLLDTARLRGEVVAARARIGNCVDQVNVALTLSD